MNDDGSHQRTMVVELPAASGGRLVGVNGVLKDREWPIQRTPFTFGRMPASHVNLDHETGSSRHHAELNSEGPYYTIVDKSANGTKVNGLPIPKGVVHPLRHNDIITICNTTFRFEHELMSEEAPEPTGVFSADSFKQSNSDDGVVVVLDAMDALARAARVEAEAVQIRSQAEAELVRIRAEAESSHQESRRFRRNIEEAADAKSSEAEAELVRLRAEAEAAQQESRRFRRLAEEAAAAKAAAAEAELAHLRAEIEEARTQAEARARVEAEARALIEARAAAEHAELEQLRSESRRFAIVKEQPAISGSPPVPNQRPGVIAPLSASGAPSGAPSDVPSNAPSNAPSSAPSNAPSNAPSGQTRNMSGSLLTTTADSAYKFSLGDNLMLILSADNLRGETLCTAARLIGISDEGELTIDCADPVSATRWNQKTVMVGKNPHNGSLLVAETKILFIDDNDYNTVRLSNPGGRLTTVQLRSSVRQRAIPEVQTFTRHDGLVCRLIDYSIGGLALVVPRTDTSERGDAIAGTLQLKRSLVFDVTIEVRGVTPLSDSPDEMMLNCRFSTREMDPETLRKIAMAVLYRR